MDVPAGCIAFTRGDGGETAVVLCPGFAWDALHAHHALRRLADEIAARGYPTLRMAYPGTADSREPSEGENDDLAAAWQASIHRAADWHPRHDRRPTPGPDRGPPGCRLGNPRRVEPKRCSGPGAAGARVAGAVLPSAACARSADGNRIGPSGPVTRSTSTTCGSMPRHWVSSRIWTCDAPSFGLVRQSRSSSRRRPGSRANAPRPGRRAGPRSSRRGSAD